ncbi:hypothetical protein ACG7TL_005133 [Trametes sanguinea]
MFSDDSDDDHDILQIPLYVHLPPHRYTGYRRHLLVVITVTMIDPRSTWVEGSWDEVSTPHPYQPAPDTPAPITPPISGVRIFVPVNVLFAPIYVLVGHVNGTSLQRRLLIAVTARELTSSDGTTALDIDFDTATLSNRRRTRPARRLTESDFVRRILLDNEPYLSPLDHLIRAVIRTPLSREEIVESTRLTEDAADEAAVEGMLG